MLRLPAASSRVAIACRCRSKSNTISRSYAFSVPRITRPKRQRCTEAGFRYRGALHFWNSTNFQRIGNISSINGYGLGYRELSSESSKLSRRWQYLFLDYYEKLLSTKAETQWKGISLPFLPSNDFVTTEIVEKAPDGRLSSWWTTTYHCPVNGKIVQSGTLANFESEGILHTSKYEEMDPSKVFISSLPYTANNEDVKKFIEKYLGGLDEVSNIHLDLGRFKGYGEIKFSDERHAREGIDKLHGKTFRGRRIRASTGDRSNFKVFYKSRDISFQACIGRIIDSLNVENKQHQRFCEEEPESFGIDIPKGQTRHSLFAHALYYFYERNGVTIDPDMYKYDRIIVSSPNGDKSLWTASFTCPLTGIKINAGTLKPHFRSLFLRGGSEVLSKKDGMVLYQNKKAAHKACTASVLDCLPDDAASRSLFENDTFERYCEEEPCVNLSAALRSRFTNDHVGRFDGDATGESVTEECTPSNKGPPPSIFQDQMSAVFEALDVEIPMGQTSHTMITDSLSSFYERNGVTIDPDMYKFDRITLATTKKGGPGLWNKSLWTANFTCPLTGIKIDTGTLKPRFRSLILGTDSVEISEEDGMVLYQNKNAAHKACTASVLDCLLNRSTFENDTALERFCEEEPCLDLSAALRSRFSDNGEGHFYGDKSFGAGVKEESTPTTKGPPSNKRFQDPMSAIFFLHRIYNPRDLRSSSVTNSLTYNSNYIDDDDSRRRRIYWSASFKSPITTEVFDSGILKNEDSVRIDGRTYYNNKKLAKMAALGHAVDCFVYRKGWINNETKTDPFRFQADDLDIYEKFCIDTPRDSAPDVNIILEPFVPPPQKDNNSEMMMTPKSVIYSRYQKVLRDKVDKDCFVNNSIEVEVDGRKLPYFTATFECPITGRVFPTGTLINAEKEVSPDSVPPLKVVDGIVYYSDKKTAEHACAGRTFDILSSTNFFSSFGGNDYNVLPQFCEEDPYSYDEESYEDEEDEDTFVIQEIPKAGNLFSGSNGNQTTMDVVLDVWADNAAFQKQPKECIPTADATTTAFSWLEKMKSEAFGSPKKDPITPATLRQTTVSTFACNAILKALANMHSTNRDDIERLSRDIIKTMIELSNDRIENSALPCAPDVTTFNSFIRCLHSPDPVVSAHRAESLLEDMLNGKEFEGYSLPKPDCNTFNAVMQHWELLSNEDSHKRISALFSRLELAMVSTKDLTPNRETFLICLRSLVDHKEGEYDTKLFCPEKANKWIKLMEKYTSSDHDMMIDTKVFNAALPRVIFDRSNERTFMNAFKTRLDEKDPLRVNALNVEEWFNSMERMSTVEGNLFVAPDIETYEAVIQAWVQTKTEEGLTNAEKWAVRTIDASSMDSDIQPSLEIFRTIMLAWAHSGSTLGPTKIQSLIDQLDELSQAFPELKPDGQVRSLFISACHNNQMNSSDPSQKGKRKTNKQNIAQNCTEYLSLMVDNESVVKKLSLDGEVFENTIGVWSGVTPEGGETVLKIISGMMQVISIYNQYIDSCNILRRHLDDPTDNVERDLQSGHDKSEIHSRIITDGDTIYQKLMQSTFDVCGENKSSRKEVVEEYFHEIEKFLLRRERYRIEFCSNDNGFEVSDKSIPFPGTLFQETMTWCKYLSCPTRNGDAVRVAMGILDHTLNEFNQDAITQSQMVDMYIRAIDVIETVVSNEIEKEMLLNRMLTDVIESDTGNQSLAILLKTKMPEGINVTSPSARRGTYTRSKRKMRKFPRRRKSIK